MKLNKMEWNEKCLYLFGGKVRTIKSSLTLNPKYKYSNNQNTKLNINCKECTYEYKDYQ